VLMPFHYGKNNNQDSAYNGIQVHGFSLCTRALNANNTDNFSICVTYSTLRSPCCCALKISSMPFGVLPVAGFWIVSGSRELVALWAAQLNGAKLMSEDTA